MRCETNQNCPWAVVAIEPATVPASKRNGMEAGVHLQVWRARQGVTAIVAAMAAALMVVAIPPATAAAPTVSNLGVDGFGSDNALRVSETRQGVDLNGDGDTFDFVFHAYESGAAVNYGLAATSVQAYEGGLVVYVNEAAQGGTDLNGDGDAVDESVLHLYDPAARTVTNIGWDVSINWGDFPQVGDTLAFPVPEFTNGVDFNGDGDMFDSTLHLWEPGLGMRNAGVHDLNSQVVDGADRFFLYVLERTTDLNGDGDTDDQVVHSFEPSSASLTNYGLATFLGGVFIQGMQSASGVAVVRVWEPDQGGTDLNGDGDAMDGVLHVLDAGLPAQNLALAHSGGCLGTTVIGAVGLLTMPVSEAAQGGVDLNGDGDGTDDVLHVWEAGTATNLGLSVDAVDCGGVPWGHVYESGVVFGVNEAEQGDSDLNGDGDSSDFVAHFYTAGSGVINLGVAGLLFSSAGGHSGIPVPEWEQGGADLNGDGDASDYVFHIFEPSSGLTNTGYAIGTATHLDDSTFLGLVPESGLGDLNGDGDATDDVLHSIDIGGTATNLGVAARDSFSAVSGGSGGVSIALVNEARQGGTDLNGDGDTSDDVAHAVVASSSLLCGGETITIMGTAGDDVLVGTGGRDVIAGLGGNDTLNGKGDDDVLCGGEGDDTLQGGPGNDVVLGDAGADLLHGGKGDDQLEGGLGDDTMRGNAGADTLLGGGGEDLMLGGSGDDVLDGGADDDRVKGGGDDDEAHGGDGDDLVNGGPGNDELTGGAGADRIFGFAGDDTGLGNGGADRLLGGTGTDDLNGGAGDDVLKGGADDDFLTGGAGVDNLNGQGGIDTCVTGETLRNCEL